MVEKTTDFVSPILFLPFRRLQLVGESWPIADINVFRFAVNVYLRIDKSGFNKVTIEKVKYKMLEFISSQTTRFCGEPAFIGLERPVQSRAKSRSKVTFSFKFLEQRITEIN